MNKKKGKSKNKFEVLLVEDNPGDVRLTIEALKEGEFISNYHVAEDGEEAMKFLNNKGKYKDMVTPDLIFLDLNLPKKDGREVLAEIKNDEELKKIPIVILTASNTDRELLKIYDLHANCYIKKPHEIEEFIKAVKRIGDYWLSIAQSLRKE